MSIVARQLRGPSVLKDAGDRLDELARRADLPLTARRRWLQAWIDTHPHWEPWLVLLQDGDAVVAAAPLARRQRGPLLDVVLLGDGPSDDLRLPAVTPALAEQLAEELRRILSASTPWRLRLRQVPVDDPVVAALARLLPATRLGPGQAMPQVEVTSSDPQSYFSRNARKNLNRSRNKIAAEGLEPELQVVREPEHVIALLPELMRVHRERDLALDRRPDHEDRSAAAFYREVITRHAAAGEVEILTLRLAGDLAAYECSLRDGRTLRVWDGRLAPRWAKVGAGRLVSAENVKHVVASPDYDLLDLMRGEEDDKLRMASRVVPTATLGAWSSPGLQRADELAHRTATRAREAIRHSPGLEKAAKRLWHQMLTLQQRARARTISGMAISKGDTVRWNTSGGETEGQAVEKKTTEFEFKGQTFKPTEDDPYWIVESAKSGSQAAHKQSTLKS